MSESWPCERCTFINNKLLPYCEACNCPQSKAAEAASPGRWRCKRCTFINQPDSLCCDACGNDPVVAPGESSQRRTSTVQATTYRRQHLNQQPVDRPEGVGWVQSGRLDDELQAQIAEAAKKVAASSSSGKFTDGAFPATDSSLLGDRHRRGTSGVEWDWRHPARLTRTLAHASGRRLKGLVKHERHGYTWKRPAELGGSWTMIGEGVDPSNIEQGELGDCWFLSVLGVLAARPHLIDRVLLTKEANQQGAYAVQFNHNGSWTQVVVDDQFPTKNNQLVYGRSKGNQLWVSVIEKAYAKLHGSYAAIAGGQAFQAMYDLTGAPCQSIDLQEEFNADVLWAQLLSFRQSKFLLAASCGRRGGSAAEAKQAGLVHQHAYSFLDVQLVEGSKLLKLNNPWGQIGWKGDWGPASARWTPVLRKQLDFDGTQPGMFWIAWPDFLHFFASIDVCKEQEGWHIATLPNKVSQRATLTPAHMFELRAPAATWMFAMMIQDNKRGETQRNEYHDFGLIVLECPEGDVGNVAKQRPVAQLWPTMARVCTLEFLAQGKRTYLLQPFSTAPRPRDLEFKFAVYSANPVFVRPVPLDLKAFRHHLLNAVGTSGQEEQLHPGMVLHNARLGVTNWILLTNADPTHHLYAEIDCTHSHNVTSSRNALVAKDTVPPRTKQLLIVVTHAVGKQESKWQTKSKFTKLSPQQLKDFKPTIHDPPLAGDDDIHAEVRLAGP